MGRLHRLLFLLLLFAEGVAVSAPPFAPDLLGLRLGGVLNLIGGLRLSLVLRLCCGHLRVGAFGGEKEILDLLRCLGLKQVDP